MTNPGKTWQVILKQGFLSRMNSETSARVVIHEPLQVVDALGLTK